jgi:3-deoxy-manno-octulosonate cytidylyltransferase (CMP-KDO synthetase)
MTSPDLQSGTDRVAAVAMEIPADFYVNVQGDEPMIDPLAIEKTVELVTSGRYPISTVMVPIRDLEELKDPSVVKVIADHEGRAIYFSRLPIPYSRGEIPRNASKLICKRHVGLYVYKRETLFQFRDLPVSGIEKGEVLEQLRALECGIPIGITEVNFISLGVDTPVDLEKVRQFLV